MKRRTRAELTARRAARAARLAGLALSVKAAPAKPRSRLRQRSRRNSYRQRPRETHRMAWIKTLPCAAKPLHRCRGRIEAHHVRTLTGVGRKPTDDMCIPLCVSAHREPGLHVIPALADKAARTTWEADRVAEYQALYDLEFPLCSPQETPGLPRAMCAYCRHYAVDGCRECNATVCPCCVDRHRQTHERMSG